MVSMTVMFISEDNSITSMANALYLKPAKFRFLKRVMG